MPIEGIPRAPRYSLAAKYGCRARGQKHTNSIPDAYGLDCDVDSSKSQLGTVSLP